jgi:uncharacterized protein YdbL (DUF1318 family)
VIARALMALAAASLGVAAAAQTPAVDAARQSGVVGERFDGYLGFVTVPAPAVRSQVNTINIRRRSLYSNFAASRGVTPADVGITAGCQLLARIEPGQYYLLTDGRWRRRATESAQPDYCR